MADTTFWLYQRKTRRQVIWSENFANLLIILYSMVLSIKDVIEKSRASIVIYCLERSLDINSWYNWRWWRTPARHPCMRLSLDRVFACWKKVSLKIAATSWRDREKMSLVTSLSLNPLIAGVTYIRVFIFLLAHSVPPFKHQLAIFENGWPPFCQIWIIFTHLKLWIASARHNFKWVEIQIE